MRRLSVLFCMTIACAFAHGEPSHTPSESNEVALAILSYAAMDVEHEIEADREYPVRYTDWNGLLDGASCPGWSRRAKESSLCSFLLDWSTNDFSRLGAEERDLLRIALCELRDLNHTNALPIVRNWAVNPVADFRMDAISLYSAWAVLGEDFLRTMGTILTNAIWATGQDRIEACLGIAGAIGRHRRRFGCDLPYTNAVHLAYRACPGNPEAGIVLDDLLIQEIPGYEWSSNRLETIVDWLATPHLDPDLVSRWVSVTNRLRESAQALVEIEDLRGL